MLATLDAPDPWPTTPAVARSICCFLVKAPFFCSLGWAWVLTLPYHLAEVSIAVVSGMLKAMRPRRAIAAGSMLLCHVRLFGCPGIPW